MKYFFWSMGFVCGLYTCHGSGTLVLSCIPIKFAICNVRGEEGVRAQVLGHVGGVQLSHHHSIGALKFGPPLGAGEGVKGFILCILCISQRLARGGRRSPQEPTYMPPAGTRWEGAEGPLSPSDLCLPKGSQSLPIPCSGTSTLQLPKTSEEKD